MSTSTKPSYDPAKLVADVLALLDRQGVGPEVDGMTSRAWAQSRSEAMYHAGELLRALGVEPAEH